MTALAGLWRFDGRPDAAQACARILKSQEMYGRHNGAQWSSGEVAVGRRLMRVLPEDVFDRQPLLGGGGRYALVADLRLDNRDELIEALRIPMQEARTFCDAAILLAAVERWDVACLERLVGDYAFALWDGARRRLFLARDPIGQRPLHYHHSDRFFAFASMPKGLHALAEVPYAPDEDRIAEHLVLMPEIGTRSFFKGIERVEPGHAVTVTTCGLTKRQHWQPSRHRVAFKRPEDYADAMGDLLDKAVHCRLRGTGDVASYLSGGLDSGAVTTTAARLLAPSRRRVIAFTFVPREGYAGTIPRNRIVDEGPSAASTAALHSNIEHVLVRNDGHSPLDDLDRNFFLLDRPAGGLEYTGLGYSFCAAMQKRKLTVSLGGGCGNMGLSYSGMELLPELLRRGQWLRLYREARALVSSRRMRWRGILVNTFGPWCPRSLWVWLHKTVNGHALEVGGYTAIHPARIGELSARASACKFDLSYRPWKDGVDMRLWGLRSVDPGNFRKAGLAGWQIDYRDPTADVRLLEFCLAVPTEQFLRDGIPRALARRALAGRLPKQVLEERRRGLQVADWHEDITAARDRIVDELDHLEACSAATTILDLPRLRRLTKDWPSSGWERDEIIMPYRYAMLRGIAAGHFLRRTMGTNRSAAN